MRSLVPLLLLLPGTLLGAFHCGSKRTAADRPASPSAASSAQHRAEQDPLRLLSKNECTDLSAILVSACQKRGNDHAPALEKWCAGILAANQASMDSGAWDETDGGTWIQDDCVRHIKLRDYFCFEGAKNAHAMMDCDRTVNRSTEPEADPRAALDGT